MIKNAVFGAWLLLPCVAAAAEPHQHGAAQLDVAIDAGIITLALRGAGDGFVGFEHAPGTDAERALVARTVALLRGGDRLFHFADAACRQDTVTVTPPPTGPDHEAHHDDEHHGGEEDHEQHDDSGHGDDHEHADWRAEWRFTCDANAAIAALRIDLFDVLPRLEEVHVQLASDAGQTSGTLTSTSRTLEAPVAP